MGHTVARGEVVRARWSDPAFWASLAAALTAGQLVSVAAFAAMLALLADLSLPVPAGPPLSVAIDFLACAVTITLPLAVIAGLTLAGKRGQTLAIGTSSGFALSWPQTITLYQSGAPAWYLTPCAMAAGLAQGAALWIVCLRRCRDTGTGA